MTVRTASRSTREQVPLAFHDAGDQIAMPPNPPDHNQPEPALNVSQARPTTQLLEHLGGAAGPEETRAGSAAGGRRAGAASVPLEFLHAAPWCPRRALEQDCASLVESLSTAGLVAPLVVRQLAPEHFEIVEGHRRLHAARKGLALGLISNWPADAAGRTLIRVDIIEANDVDAIRRNLTSGTEQRPLSQFEECVAIVRLWEALSVAQGDALSSREFERRTGVTHTRALQARRIVSCLTDEMFIRAGFVINGGVDWARVNRLTKAALLAAAQCPYAADGERQAILEGGLKPIYDDYGVAQPEDPAHDAGEALAPARQTAPPRKARPATRVRNADNDDPVDPDERGDAIREAAYRNARNGEPIRIRVGSTVAQRAGPVAQALFHQCVGVALAVAPAALAPNQEFALLTAGEAKVIIVPHKLTRDALNAIFEEARQFVVE